MGTTSDSTTDITSATNPTRGTDLPSFTCTADPAGTTGCTGVAFAAVVTNPTSVADSTTNTTAPKRAPESQNQSRGAIIPLWHEVPTAFDAAASKYSAANCTMLDAESCHAIVGTSTFHFITCSGPMALLLRAVG